MKKTFCILIVALLLLSFSSVLYASVPQGTYTSFINMGSSFLTYGSITQMSQIVDELYMASQLYENGSFKSEVYHTSYSTWVSAASKTIYNMVYGRTYYSAGMHWAYLNGAYQLRMSNSPTYMYIY